MGVPEQFRNPQSHQIARSTGPRGVKQTRSSVFPFLANPFTRTRNRRPPPPVTSSPAKGYLLGGPPSRTQPHRVAPAGQGISPCPRPHRPRHNFEKWSNGSSFSAASSNRKKPCPEISRSGSPFRRKSPLLPLRPPRKVSPGKRTVFFLGSKIKNPTRPGGPSPNNTSLNNIPLGTKGRLCCWTPERNLGPQKSLFGKK